MSYLLERAAEAHRNELLREAQRERQVRLYVGQRSSFRRSFGRFMVQAGFRLSGERRQEPRLVGVGESG